ncbi:hypothetical protein CANCADRAFT_3760 [Tortispora caseinolytica NRRL Y-17796]|uniref:Protein CMS1 n=1 Tax=Tortispora caseinolytica NRRL Y-17796 TaxID=767744 RepID=A0A1E4TBI8_9ASCO|nr:hypothetical protein CANCADRAFT_3760 [Tortispora caseinolytica NRRL Y-17796]
MIDEGRNNSYGGDDLDDELDYVVDLDHGSEAEADVTDETAAIATVNTSTDAKRKRDKNKKDSKLKKKLRMEEECDKKRQLALLPSDIIADYLAKRVKQVHKELSTIELNELYIPSSQIVQTSDFIDRELKSLPKFLKKYTSPKGEGSIIILSSSALRVCDVYRAIRSSVSSVKLISKNSLQHDKDLINKVHPKVLLSTPLRTVKLIDEQIISNSIETVVIDSTFLDVKKRHVVDDEHFAESMRQLKDRSVDCKFIFY